MQESFTPSPSSASCEGGAASADFRYAWPAALGQALRLCADLREEASQIRELMSDVQQKMSGNLAARGLSCDDLKAMNQKLSEVHEGQASVVEAVDAAIKKHVQHALDQLLARSQQQQSNRLEELEVHLLYMSQQHADRVTSQAEVECDRQYAKAEELIAVMKDVCGKVQRQAAQLAAQQRDRAADEQLRLSLKRSGVWARLCWLISGEFRTSTATQPHASKAA